MADAETAADSADGVVTFTEDDTSTGTLVGTATAKAASDGYSVEKRKQGRRGWRERVGVRKGERGEVRGEHCQPSCNGRRPHRYPLTGWSLFEQEKAT